MSKLKGKKPNPTVQARILIEQEGRCSYCNASLLDQPVHWDHIVPFSWTGLNSQNNFAAACVNCNKKKWNIIFRHEDDVFNFSKQMICLHGSFGEGWPENSTKWQQVLQSQI